jgi:hypothetical protein
MKDFAAAILVLTLATFVLTVRTVYAGEPLQVDCGKPFECKGQTLLQCVAWDGTNKHVSPAETSMVVMFQKHIDGAYNLENGGTDSWKIRSERLTPEKLTPAAVQAIISDTSCK